jgi:hypothetical protein
VYDGGRHSPEGDPNEAGVGLPKTLSHSLQVSPPAEEEVVAQTA